MDASHIALGLYGLGVSGALVALIVDYRGLHTRSQLLEGSRNWWRERSVQHLGNSIEWARKAAAADRELRAVHRQRREAGDRGRAKQAELRSQQRQASLSKFQAEA